MEKNIAVIWGDCSSPEIVKQTLRVLDQVAEKYGHTFHYTDAAMGGEAIDKYGDPLPRHELDKCLAADSVLLGAVGGPKWEGMPGDKRPEKGLLRLRAGMGLYSNLRPAKIWPQLAPASPLKPEIVAQGIDFIIVRELIGGVYFGKHETHTLENGEKQAIDSMPYSEHEIERIGRIGFETAQKRRKKLCCVDKANVLDTSRLWRSVMHRLQAEYPDVEYSEMFVDNCAMQIVKNPAQFDVIVTALRRGLRENGLPEAAVSLIEDTTHASANALMTAVGYVDLLIPRGGAGLIRACVENAKVPCIQTGTGICHIFVDDSADQPKALEIIENAKASRPSVCNAEEVCLVHSGIAAEFLPKLAQRLGPDRAARGLHPVELRLDERAAALLPGIGVPAGPQDFDTEFLDYILAVKIVDSVEEAIAHIAAHSTGHSEAILTQDNAHAAQFTAAVDSAAVYVNCSTRFTDGGEFGLGCEMGISTQKLHARGPMGLAELCSYKYIIHGNGQIR